MVRVLSAGVGRSGSTWLFNATMSLLEQKCSAYGAWVDRWDVARAESAEALVLKVHGASQIGDFKPDIITTCHRDLRDVALSLRDYQSLAEDQAILDGVSWARACHDEFAPVAQIDLAYEQMIDDPLGALAALASALGVTDADIGAARAKTEAWEPLPGDAKHRFDGRPGRWRSQLSTDLRNGIETRHGDWLARLGYLDADAAAKRASQ